MRAASLTLWTTAILTLCAACGGGEPRVRTRVNVSGDYVLVARDGNRLPHTLRVLDGNGRPCTTTLVRLVLTLHPDGSWVQEGGGNSQCPGEAAPRQDPINEAGEYHLRGPRGDTILLRDTIHPLPEMNGVFRGDELHTVMVFPPPQDTARFRYVRQPTRD